MALQSDKMRIFFAEPYYTIYWNENTGKVKVTSTHSNRDLTIRVNEAGYLTVKVANKSLIIHQFIGEKLFGKKVKGMCINHIDGNKLNNCKDNLEYITIAENVKHAVRMGLHPASDPKRSGRYKDGRATKENLKEYKYNWLKTKNEKRQA